MDLQHAGVVGSDGGAAGGVDDGAGGNTVGGGQGTGFPQRKNVHLEAGSGQPSGKKASA